MSQAANLAGELNTRGWKKSIFKSTEIAVYLGNGTRQVRGYDGSLIKSYS